MRPHLKKILSLSLSLIILLCTINGCGRVEKNISVIVREQGSGTREAFDSTVTDGTHFLEERSPQGKKIYNTTKKAIQQTKTGTVIYSVASDKNAIGYISLSSLGKDVNVVKINGVMPSEESILSGDYKIRRPYVVMTSNSQPLSERAEDFMKYLKSDLCKEHVRSAGCIFITDPQKRANEGKEEIAVSAFVKLSALPDGKKMVIRGSTSLEKFINSAAKGYAELYGVKAQDIFDIQLEGSSVGRKAVEKDSSGNIIGLSSAYVDQDSIDSFNVCLDAIVVIVNKENKDVSDLTLAQLYGIFSGKITKFKELKEKS